MSWLVLSVLIGAAGDANAVYHFRDRDGVDHYVNHPEQIPQGTPSSRSVLDQDLNPELAKALAADAHRAAEEAKAAAADAGAPTPAALPTFTKLVLVWTISLSVVFLILWASAGILLQKSPPLAVVFRPIRMATGALAVISWIYLGMLMRHSRPWLAAHVPPLRAISDTQSAVEKINQQQRDAERELEKALNERGPEKAVNVR